LKPTSAVPTNFQIRLENLYNGFIPLSLFIGGIAGILVVVYNQPANILLAVFGLLIVLATVFSSEFGLLVLAFLVYTRFSDVVIEFHGFPSVAKFFMVLLVVAIIARWAIFRDSPQGWLVPAILLGAYGLAGLGSILYSPVPDRAWMRLTDYIKDGTIAIIVVILLQKGRTLRWVLWALLISGIFLGTLSVYQYATDSFDSNFGGFAVSGYHQIIGDQDEYRVGGPIGDPNFFAQIMVVLVPISLERFLHEKKTSLKLLASLALVLSVSCVILSYSRGGFLAMAVVLMAFFFMYPPRSYYIPFIIITVLVMTLFLPPSYLDRILTLGDLLQANNSLRVNELSFRGRLSENLAAWEMIRTHPIFGVGLNSYGYLFGQYAQIHGIALVAAEREPHNLYLEVLAETGIVGFILFMVLIGTTFRTIYHARLRFLDAKLFDYVDMVSGFGLGLFGYLTASMFIHGAFARYLYLLLGIGLSLPLVVRNTLSTELKE
jgi:O-antigen ligase